MAIRRKGDFTRPNDADDSIDREMEESLKPEQERADNPISMKRQWDADLEAELNAAMEGFDAASFDVETKQRSRAADRAHVPKGNRGQELDRSTQKGKVIGLRGKSLFVDLGAKSEGVVPVEQFGEKPLPNPGEMIDVIVDRFDTDEGLLILSLKGAAVEADWENLRKGLIVEARPTKVNKGGLEVVVNGIRGFLPIGQIDINRVDDPNVYLNQKLRVMVTEANQRERNLVVSRRELLEREREELKELTWKALEEGQIRQGVIRSIKDFGAFVDLGGVDGLIHVSDLSWTRVSDVGSVVKVGQEVQVKVLKIDRQTSKVSLGLKQLMPSPWDNIEDRYHRGQFVHGKVTRLMDFGAFVELEPGVEGLIHLSELASKRVFRVKDHVQVGQEVDVRILQIDEDAKKISLSLKPLPEAPKAEAPPAEDEAEAPAAPKPQRLVPLKGGLGDRDKDPFSLSKDRQS
jgi:small subunit ribosomal protein S1